MASAENLQNLDTSPEIRNSATVSRNSYYQTRPEKELRRAFEKSTISNKPRVRRIRIENMKRKNQVRINLCKVFESNARSRKEFVKELSTKETINFRNPTNHQPLRIKKENVIRSDLNFETPTSKYITKKSRERIIRKTRGTRRSSRIISRSGRKSPQG